MEDRLINVYIPMEKSYGTIEKLGAYASVVTYSSGGILYEELLENEDFIIINE